MAQHIVVEDYDPRWEALFQQEAAVIRRILGENCLAVHHIGSTAVPGLAAKPVIDILPVVRSLERTDAARKAFEAAGYEYLGEFGIPGRRYLRRGGDWRTHQLHIFAETSRREIRRHLAVCAYLRAHPAACEAYGELKRMLAQRYPDDIEGYCDGKDAFVQELEAAALRWSGPRVLAEG